jgi:type IV secretion system protein VirB11
MNDRASFAVVPEREYGADDETSLTKRLRPLRPLLDDVRVTEICINEPGGARVERYSGWTYEPLPFCTFEWCRGFAALIANYTKQKVSAIDPLLSATLPTGERIQVVMPPVTPEGCISFTIRRASPILWTLDQFASAAAVTTMLSDGSSLTLTLDVFRDTRVVVAPSDDDDLGALLRGRDFVGFLRRAVQQRKNVLLSGATGSGKTTLAKALILEIAIDDRVITIEDVRELILENQPNHVAMVYSQRGQGQAQVSGYDLLVSALRMRPDWLIPSEIRTGDEAYGFLNAIGSGHSSITSVHAGSATAAFVEIAQKLRRSEACRGMSLREGVELAQMNVDVVVQCARSASRRHVSQIWYDPSTKQVAA